MVTHNPECAERAPRRIHMLDGRIVDVAPPATPLVAAGRSVGAASRPPAAV
jgi:ABC-type lipoprotein export system ATPase subunit